MAVLMNEDRATVDCPTTRRYSRTLAEAFADERASAVEPWIKESASDSARRLIPAIFGYAIALLCVAILMTYMLPAHAGRRDCCGPFPPPKEAAK